MEDAAELVDSSGTKLATWRTNKPSTKYDVKRAVAALWSQALAPEAT